MEFTAEWAAIYAAVLIAIGGGIGASAQRAIQRRRDASPLLRWDNGYLGVTNRINEHIWISKVSANCRISLGEYRYDDGGSLIPDSDRIYDSPMSVMWEVDALGRGLFQLLLRGKCDCIELTVCSSLKTIRHRRFTVMIRTTE